MFDPTGYIQTGGAILAGVLASMVINRRSKRAARDQTQIDNSAARVTAEASTQIARHSAEAEFLKEILARVASLEKQVDESNRRMEVQVADSNRRMEVQRMYYEDQVKIANAKFEAREDQLINWGTWEKAEPPRRAPAFVWPLPPGTGTPS